MNEVIGGALAAIGTLLALLSYVSQCNKNLREMIQAGDADTAKDEAAQRLALAGSVEQHRADIEALKRDSVRREELRALEGRLDAMTSRFDAKLDRILDRLTEVAVLAARNDTAIKREVE